MSKFSIDIVGSVILTKEQIWPDGDGPENPTVDDVLYAIEEVHGLSELLSEWSLEDHFHPVVNKVK